MKMEQLDCISIGHLSNIINIILSLVIDQHSCEYLFEINGRGYEIECGEILAVKFLQKSAEI